MTTPNTTTMNPKDLERAAVSLVRGGFNFNVQDGVIEAMEPIEEPGGLFRGVELRTLHAVRKFLEVRA